MSGSHLSVSAGLEQNARHRPRGAPALQAPPDQLLTGRIMVTGIIEMTALGIMLLVLGAVLVVAEAHLPSGALGAAGGVALMIGGIVAIAALGGGAALAVPVGTILGVVAVGWTMLAMRVAASTRHRRVLAGGEALCGRIGVVRGWSGAAGQVFVEGALWRARQQPAELYAYSSPATNRDHDRDPDIDRDPDRDPDRNDSLHEGDQIVVERITGLTLSVRRAEEWELIV